MIFIGIILILIVIMGKVQQSAVATYDIDKNQVEVEFTGIEGVIFTLGILTIIAAFVFKYKKFPKLA